MPPVAVALLRLPSAIAMSPNAEWAVAVPTWNTVIPSIEMAKSFGSKASADAPPGSRRRGPDTQRDRQQAESTDTSVVVHRCSSRSDAGFCIPDLAGFNADTSRASRAITLTPGSGEQPRQESVVAAVAERHTRTDKGAGFAIRRDGVVTRCGDVCHPYLDTHVLIVGVCAAEVLGERRLRLRRTE